MRRILAGVFVLTLLAVALAAPPIDYELTCGEGGELIGVLSLTEGKVHVALVAEAVCDGVDVFVSGPDGAPEIGVIVDWDTDPPTVTVTVDEAEADDVDLVVVPPVAVDGMLNAQRLRAAAMERRAEAMERHAEAMEKREEAYARREAAREGRAWDGEDGEEGDDPPAGPPEDLPPGDRPGGPPAVLPPVEGPGGRP